VPKKPRVFSMLIYNDVGFFSNGRIILIWIFRKWDVGAWTGSIWLEFLDQLRSC